MDEDTRSSGPRGQGARAGARRFFSHENAALALVFVGIVVAMTFVTGGKSIARINMRNVMLQSAIRGIASVGQAFVILTGNIDLSIQGIGILCALTGATLMTKNMFLNIVGQSLPVPLVLLLVLLVGAAWGVANGFLVSRTRIPSLIATLGIWEVTRGLAFDVGKGAAVTQQPEALAFFGSGNVAGVPVPVIIFVTVAAVSYFILNHATYGRLLYAIGGNPSSAWLSGIRVQLVTFSVFVISGLLSGLAGFISIARVMSASMNTMQTLMLDTIAAVVIGGVSLMGGRGNILGVVIGVMIIGVINNGMSIIGAPPSTLGVVKGLIIIFAVIIDYRRQR